MPPKAVLPPNTYVLSPSDLTYLWDDCPRCFWLRYVKGLRRPGAFPRVFGQIDRAMRAEYNGKAHRVGTFDCSEKKVASKPYKFGEVTLSISGKIDARLNTGEGVILVDFKCSGDKHEAAAKYTRQLAAYALGVENTLGQKVVGLALLMFSPESFYATAGGSGASLLGEMHWLPIVRDDKAFEAFLAEVAALLSKPIPAQSADCYFCNYVEGVKSL